MKIYIVNKKTKEENIQKKYPDALILDVTSTSKYESLRILSPFYPHRNIPIPGMLGKTAVCVEAIWQGLKIFENCGVDYSTFCNDTMQDIKRTVRKYGKPVGHKYENRIINYADARWLIYLPSYLYMLENFPNVQNTIVKIKEKLKEKDIVLLDYNTNCNIADYSKPLSHAGLIKLYIEGEYPNFEDRLKYETWNKILELKECYEGTKEDFILSIISHSKYEHRKHDKLIKKIKSMKDLNFKEIAVLGGKGRTKWREIIKDIQNPQKYEQLSLF